VKPYFEVCENNSMTEAKAREILKPPLKFGDERQIAALKFLREVEDAEKFIREESEPCDEFHGLDNRYIDECARCEGTGYFLKPNLVAMALQFNADVIDAAIEHLKRLAGGVLIWLLLVIVHIVVVCALFSTVRGVHADSGGLENIRKAKGQPVVGAENVVKGDHSLKREPDLMSFVLVGSVLCVDNGNGRGVSIKQGDIFRHVVWLAGENQRRFQNLSPRWNLGIVERRILSKGEHLHFHFPRDFPYGSLSYNGKAHFGHNRLPENVPMERLRHDPSSLVLTHFAGDCRNLILGCYSLPSSLLSRSVGSVGGIDHFSPLIVSDPAVKRGCNESAPSGQRYPTLDATLFLILGLCISFCFIVKGYDRIDVRWAVVPLAISFVFCGYGFGILIQQFSQFPDLVADCGEITVLHLGPVTSPLLAVRAAIVREFRENAATEEN
jgi:hypothetical protein